MPESDSSKCIRFGVFEADLSTGVLRKHGLRIKLQPQAFRILVHFLRHPGQVFAVDDLRQKLWPANLYQSRKGVKVAINKLRAALGDSAGNPRFVETVARRGYRFILPMASPPSVAAQAQPPRIRIAVLPFSTSNPTDRILSTGIAAEIIRQLCLLDSRRLGVVPGATTMRHAQLGKGPEEIARELRVDYIIEGSFAGGCPEVRVDVKLARLRDGVDIWSEMYKSHSIDRLELHAAIGQQVAQAIVLHLLGPGAPLATA